MAVLHAAWTFSPQQFLATLASRVVVDERIQAHLLLDWARATATQPSKDAQKAMDWMRYDEADWLDPSDPDIPRWFMLALASQLTLAPSLSNRYTYSWWVLEKVLPIAGWPDTEVRRLIYGRSLSEMVQSSNNQTLVSGLDLSYPFGGWLSLDDAKHLSSQLQAVEGQFSAPSDQSIEIIQSVVSFPKNTGEILQDAYVDAVQMLQAAIDRENALLMIVD
jgi:hypothetical protein